MPDGGNTQAENRAAERGTMNQKPEFASLMDQTDWSNPSALSRYCQRRFEERVREFTGLIGMRFGKDIDRKRTIRKSETALRNIEAAREMTGDCVHEYPGVFSFAKEWLELNAYVSSGYDEINNREDLSTAAALWILDRLYERHALYSTEQTILPVLTASQYYRLPGNFEAADLMYSSMTVSKVIYALIHRNDDCKVYRQKGDIPRVFIDEAAVRGKQNQDVPSRRVFEQLMEAVGQEAIDAAAAHFREKYRQLIRIYFGGMDELWKKLNDEIQKHEKAVDRIAGHAILLADSKNRILAEPGSLEALYEETGHPESPVMGYVERMYRHRDRIAELKERIEDCRSSFREFTVITDELAEEIFPESMCALMKDFAVEDPYEMAFALLYLADRGDDLIWMYYFGTSLAEMTAAALPWADVHDPFETDELLSEEEKAEDELSALFRQMKYVDKAEEVWFGGEKESLEQLFYRETGYVMPRNLSRYSWVREELEDYGVPRNEQDLLMLALNFAYAADRRYESEEPDFTEDFMTENEPPEEEPGENADQLKELRVQVRELKKENRALREAAWKEQKKSQKLEEKLQEQIKDSEEDRRELSGLRETLFLMEKEEEEKEDTSIAIPYRNRNKIVICGGHDTFLKQIRPMLTGDVRYLANVRINEDLIRSADAVWLQTNAISHSDYYKIIDLCRKVHIPYYYFTRASARKCAEQIVIQERNQKDG